jgi:D-amino-acid dehydrogenase
VLAGALHWTQPIRTLDPQGLGQAYLRRFEQLGGAFVQGNAATLGQEGGRWTLRSAKGPLEAPTGCRSR